MEDEKEVIVMGGGTFYKSDTYDDPGFKDIEDPDSYYREYETWYSFRKHTGDLSGTITQSDIGETRGVFSRYLR